METNEMLRGVLDRRIEEFRRAVMRMVGMNEWGGVCIFSVALIEALLLRDLLRRLGLDEFKRVLLYFAARGFNYLGRDTGKVKLRKALRVGTGNMVMACVAAGVVGEATGELIERCTTNRNRIHTGNTVGEDGTTYFTSDMAQHALETVSLVEGEISHRADMQFPPPSVGAGFRKTKTRQTKPGFSKTRSVLFRTGGPLGSGWKARRHAWRKMFPVVACPDGVFAV